MDYLAITGAVTAGLSAVAAGGSWMAARRANKTSAQAQETAERAYETAEAVARIEQARWHAELTPQFDLELMEYNNGQALLKVHLDGPDALRHLDEIAITVGNDDRNHDPMRPDGIPTQEDVDAFVFGPFRFTPDVNGTDRHGRGPEPFALDVGAGHPFAMQRSQPAPWMEGKSQAMWQGEYVGQPIRLTLTCRRGDEEWVIARRLENPPFGPQA